MQEDLKQTQHVTVLLQEAVDYLNPQPGKVYVDATLGGAGHTRALLTQQPECTVIGLDWDKSVIDTTGQALKEEFGDRFIPMYGNFSKIYELIARAGFSKVDGILADFGTSQIQIHNTPGFSVYKDTFLDMRFSPGMYQMTAYDVVNKFSQKDLADIFFEFAQETRSRKIAEMIVNRRKIKRFKTTIDLAESIKKMTPGSYHKIHPATKVFQALRIFINQELQNIQAFLANAGQVLNPEGRLVCISFHSLEDRLVKQFFKDKSRPGSGPFYFELLTKRACVASPEEVARNRSSRSARLRAAILKNFI